MLQGTCSMLFARVLMRSPSNPRLHTNQRQQVGWNTTELAPAFKVQDADTAGVLLFRRTVFRGFQTVSFPMNAAGQRTKSFIYFASSLVQNISNVYVLSLDAHTPRTRARCPVCNYRKKRTTDIITSLTSHVR